MKPCQIHTCLKLILIYNIGMNNVTAIFGISIAGAIAVILVCCLRPGVDNTTLITCILGFLTSSFSLIKSLSNGNDIQNLHLIVNSRLTELLQQTARASELAGRANEAAENAAARKSPRVPPNPTA
jgi:hypothetical protein